MAAPGGASSISVSVRVRPFTIREAAQLTKCDDGPLFLGDGSLASAPTPKLKQKGIRSVIKVVDDKCLVFDPPEDNPMQRFSRSVIPNSKRVKDQTFAFDRVFDENTSQGDVYESTTRNLLDSVLDGYNATVFAYGATGCGKTHTITGTAQQPGIIFLTMQELFERISEINEEKVTEISLSYLEIYNETIRDLLVPGNTKGGLMLREDAHQAVSVAGLSSHHPQNVQEVMDMIMRGNECRTMSPTEANATSSRSHAVLQINVAQKDRNSAVSEPHTMATLSIIDLAGSERASATKNRGERLTEGANINKSLLALGSCINALCDPRKRNHVPYRNSKLTRLLKFSLGGNCKTVMIVCVSPSSQHFDETQNTLRYANRAKNIQTKVTRNVYNVNRHVKDFLVKIDEQMALINELKAQQKDYENIAFAKFRKSNEKKESIAKEGIARIRSAYDHSALERQERVANMIKLRQISRRIAVLSSWIAAFDNVCDSLEMDEPMRNLQAVRKTAQGIMIELENSRHHCSQKVNKSTWDRALNSALENGLRQLKEVDTGDSIDAETLSREVELLKANTEREALCAVNEQDKGGDAATVQVLLQAHFETISAIDRLNQMGVDEAVEHATSILGKMLSSCTRAASHVVKPDGSLAPVEALAPTKTGTPKRRKPPAAVVGGTPLKAPNAALAMAPHIAPSPMRGSPKRRALLGSARKGVSFTPKKRKSPSKGLKRGVRWKDDTGDGTLAEFEKTPRKYDTTPEVSSNEVMLPLQPPTLTSTIPAPTTEQTGSSPIPAPPETDVNVPRNSRFKAGFLSKKSSADGSPLSQSILPPVMTQLSSSDNEPDNSPLRPLEPTSRALNRSSLSDAKANQSDSSNSSNSSATGSDTENTFSGKDAEAFKVRSAIKRRVSSATFHSRPNPGTAPGHLNNAQRTQRRRSPTAATGGSPPPEGLFTAGQARRMVRSEKENEWKASVLSPRTGPISKNNRRTTLGMDGARREGSLSRSKERLHCFKIFHRYLLNLSSDRTEEATITINLKPQTIFHFAISLLSLFMAFHALNFSAMPTYLTRLLRPFTTSSSLSLAGDSTSTAASSLPPNAQKATVAAGCFWGVEHLYRRHFSGKGLLDARVGYTGGSSSSPSYRQVCSGRTGHAEALQITFDPDQVSYRTLLEFFFRMHDPTTLNRQGMDTGTQYRSGIWAHDEEQLRIAEEVKAKVAEKWYKGKPVTTTVEMLDKWWDAEDYHQLYLEKTPGGYECPAHFVRNFKESLD
ncbi:MAG: hypothetical protein Q9227_000064 [Pyrenula ochraceoflavens]